MYSGGRRLAQISSHSLAFSTSVRPSNLARTGRTISDARGRGDKGVRASHWGHSANIRVEVVCDTPLAERVLARLREKYYEIGRAHV